jgi:hypothetical protein
VNGATAGDLTLVQTAVAGDLGFRSPGHAGNASSVVDRTAAARSFLVQANATGGSGTNNASGLWGAATAVAGATNTGGSARAEAIATAGTNGTATASATANTAGGVGQAALAHTTARGERGTADAGASAAAGRFTRLVAHASAPAVAAQSQVESRAAVGAPAPALPAQFLTLHSIAYATGSPTASDATAATATSPHLAARIAPDQVIALGTLAGASANGNANGNAASHTYAASLAMTAGFADVTGPHDLFLGFHDPQVGGLGFDTLELTVRRHGAATLTQAFSGVAAASAYLTDHLIDLGSLNTPGVDAVDMDITMTLTTARANDGVLANLVLASVPTTPGDANHDGGVDFADLVVLAQNYNTPGGRTFEQGDFTGDGSVDFADLVQLAQHYNSVAPDGLSGAPAVLDADLAAAFAGVPEPGGAAPLVTGALGALGRRRRRL